MIRLFLRNELGASAAEFALILPLLLTFLLGIIDLGRLMYVWNQAEKATQMGARFAVVTDMVPTNLRVDFALQHGLVGGDPVPTSTFASTTCDNTDCTPDWGYDGVAFGRIVDRIALFFPAVNDQNVTITYENVGLGFAGDPNGPDVAALVTVRLRGLSFQPVLLALFGGSLTLPPFSSALTMEDGLGAASN